MWFEQIVRKETGCASYIIGSTEKSICAVFDPLWDIEPYIKIAQEKNSYIKFVIDSHSHADHISGARRLAKLTSAKLIIPELAQISYPSAIVKDGDLIDMGEVSLRILHVPGHRPEQINLLIFDHSRGEEPWCLLTADFLLVGDIARPDLAQGGIEGAKAIFETSIPKINNLPDFVEVYPGHVAGST